MWKKRGCLEGVYRVILNNQCGKTSLERERETDRQIEKQRTTFDVWLACVCLKVCVCGKR